MNLHSLACTTCLVLGFSTPLWAQTVAVSGAWARATVPGQLATGAYMRLKARESVTLVSIRTPVAGVAEVHAMKLDDGMMVMRAVPDGLPLPAGKTVEFKPGGYHLMLMDLAQPLKAQSSIPLTLVFKDAKGVQSTVELTLPVALQAPAGAAKP